jgi:hypothetical protein
MIRKSPMNLSEYDVRFIVETVDSGLLDKLDIIKSDRDILDKMLDTHAEDLFRKISAVGDGILTRITPRLLFEILVRKTSLEITEETFILERTATGKIPVFDTREVGTFLRDKKVRSYLAEMLDSFTRTESFTLPLRVRKGIWRKIRYSDMDIRSLMYLCRCSDEEHRFKFYKRIGDLCLFTLGMFPEHAAGSGNFCQGETIPERFDRRGTNYYEEGKKFYKLAAEHKSASLLGLDEVFTRLHEEFDLARRPLNYISEHYLQFRKQQLFPDAQSG